jgi:hypothetical protein
MRKVVGSNPGGGIFLNNSCDVSFSVHYESIL